jgi:hypothetical protein
MAAGIWFFPLPHTPYGKKWKAFGFCRDDLSLTRQGMDDSMVPGAKKGLFEWSATPAALIH